MMRLRRFAVGLVAVSAVLSPAAGWSQTCGLCASVVVISPHLAQCLLSQYDALATDDDGGAIAIDLTGCEQDRGIVEALPSLSALAPEPDLQFFVSRRQLDCLKTRIEAPGSVEPPVSTIDLSTCE